MQPFLFFLFSFQIWYVLSATKFGLRSRGAIIGNKQIIMGINDAGSLNIPYVGGVFGLPAKDPTKINWIGLRNGNGRYAATEAGAKSEGWGCAVRLSGSKILQFPTAANQHNGFLNLLPINFIGRNGGTSAISIVKESKNRYRVKHECKTDYAIMNVVKCKVTITNTYIKDFLNVHYRRTMDWDISPTPFKEYVSIKGWGKSKFLYKSATNGFIKNSPTINLPPNKNNNKNINNAGPGDLGALLEFRFPVLKKGKNLVFNIYYGVSKGQSNALTTLASIKAEAFSLGKPGNSITGFPYTFFFGFTGVGGVPVLPTIKPLPTPKPPKPTKPIPTLPTKPGTIEECINFIDFPSVFCIDDEYKYQVERIKTSGHPLLYKYVCPNTDICGSFKCTEKISKVVMKKTFNAKYLDRIKFIINYHQYKYIHTILGKSIGTFSISCDNEKTYDVLKEYKTCDNGVYKDVILTVTNKKCERNDNIIFKYELECFAGDIDIGIIGKLCINAYEEKEEEEEDVTILVDENQNKDFNDNDIENNNHEDDDRNDDDNNDDMNNNDMNDMNDMDDDYDINNDYDNDMNNDYDIDMNENDEMDAEYDINNDYDIDMNENFDIDQNDNEFYNDINLNNNVPNKHHYWSIIIGLIGCITIFVSIYFCLFLKGNNKNSQFTPLIGLGS